MEKRTLSIAPIYYKRKVYDEGVILGTRPWKWTLGNKYSPCSARRIDNNLQVSTISPHKQNFQVYISKHAIEPGDTYKIVNHEYGKDRVETVLQVALIGGNYVECDVIEETIVKREVPTYQAETLGDQTVFAECPLNPDGQNRTERTEELTDEETQNLAELLDFFGHPEEEELQTYSGALPAKVSPEVIEDIDKDSLPLPSPRIMITEKFVNGKNQMGFGFIMKNEGKQQQSLFALPENTTNHSQPDEPRKAETPAKIRDTSKPPQIVGFSNEEIAILDAIGKGAEHIDSIIHKSGINAGMVAGMLLMLEMKDIVTQKPGRYFTRT